MKMKERVDKLEELLAQLRTEFDEEKAKRLHAEYEAKRREVTENHEVEELREFPPDVPSIWYRYSFRDVSHLLEWRKLPTNAGPLFFTTLIGISGLAGLCYGRSHPKRCFTKLVKQDMGISEPVLGELLYECKRYLHKKSTWVPGTVITTSPTEDQSVGAIFYRISDKEVLINVTELAQRYLGALNIVFETGDAGAHPLGPGIPDLVVREAAKVLQPPEDCCTEVQE